MSNIQYVRKVKIPIYDVYLLISFDLEYLAKHYPGMAHTLAGTEGLEYAKALVFDGEHQDEAMICVHIHRENAEPNTIAHEALHVAYTVLDGVGVPITFDNQEAVAYLTGWVVEVIDRHWFQLLEKENAQINQAERAEEGAGKLTTSGDFLIIDDPLCP